MLWRFIQRLRSFFWGPVLIILFLMLLIIVYLGLVAVENYLSYRDRVHNCYESPTMSHMYIHFKGFTQDELRNIIVKRYENNRVVESFVVTPKCMLDNLTKTNCLYHYFSLDNVIIADTYEFIVTNNKPYKLYNMKKTFYGDYYMFFPNVQSCLLKSYTINGVNYIADYSDFGPYIQKDTLIVK